MRTYLILKEKVARFNADAEIQALLGGARRARRGDRRARASSPTELAQTHQGRSSSTCAAMRDQGYAYERLDQLTMELLLGVR